MTLEPGRSSDSRSSLPASSDDAPLISQALGGLARVALRTDVPEGRRLAHEALEVSEAAGDEGGRSNALHLLGVGAQIAGDLPEARDWMTKRLALVRSLGNDFLVASEASNLSMVERQLGNLDVGRGAGSRSARGGRAHRRRVHEAVRDRRTGRDRHRAGANTSGLRHCSAQSRR